MREVFGLDMRLALLPTFALLLASSQVDAQGKLWVVDDDGGPGVDFTAIQDAVDAAVDGDGILVRPGDYGRVTIDGKSLRVIDRLGSESECRMMKSHASSILFGFGNWR